jgi:hypothetical protein
VIGPVNNAETEPVTAKTIKIIIVWKLFSIPHFFLILSII